MIGPLLVVAFVVVPLLEIAVLLQVGQALGTLPALALLLVISVVGAVLARREGARAWRALRAELAHGGLPGRQVADGALVLVGATLLLTPGFVTDGLGLLLVVPPTRAVLRRLLLRWAAARAAQGSVGFFTAAAAEADPPRRRGPGAGQDVVDGEVVDGEVVDDGGADEPGRP